MSGRSHVATLTAAALLVLACPGQTGAADGIVQDELTPTAARPGAPVTATLKVHASECTTVQRMGVAVRDALWNHGDDLDFPGSVKNARICPEGFTLTTDPRSFRAGTYTMFGYYMDESGYHQLSNIKLRVISSGRAADPSAGKKRVWSEEFDAPIEWGDRWTNTGTSAFKYGTHNPDNGQLDWVDPDHVRVADGVVTFTARPGRRTLENGRRAWDTGLITTEGSRQGFRVRTGDYVESRVRLPIGLGAWPAVWTWWDDGNEIDMFEYHPDTPNLLEMVNHVRYAANYHTISPPRTGKGKWTRIGVVIGAKSADWYVDGVLVYQDGHGVGRNWSAYVNINLSVSSGTFHPMPQTKDPITFNADHLRVYR